MLSDFIKKVRADTHFRIKLLLRLSVIFNAAYSLFLFVVSQISDSEWFFVMAVYYGVLFIVRIFIFSQIEPERALKSKLKTVRNCGYFLVLINLVVSVLIFILIYKDQAVTYHEITVIALATYTFWTLTMSIINSVKYIRRRNYVYSCAKLVSLVCASVSIVTLTNTMLFTFGEENVLLRSIILPILSVVVCSFIIASAWMMVRKANLQLRILKNEEKRE